MKNKNFQMEGPADFLMKQKAMKRVLEEDSKPFEVEKIFDKGYKEGKKIKVAPKKKESNKAHLAASFTCKCKAANKSFYKYESY